MKLVFYSDFDKEKNKVLDKKVVELINNSTANFSFIPSQTDVTEKHFNKFKEYYSGFGFNNFECFDIDEEFDQKKLQSLINSDIIFLSGGNTFYFLEKIKTNHIDDVLQKFSKTPEKILIGVSAGAMIMTPTIMNTVVQHKITGDFEALNKSNLEDFSGLNLVNFEFIPHFSEVNKGQMIKKYLPETKNVVYGCPDGSGIIINGNNIFLSENIIKLK